MLTIISIFSFLKSQDNDYGWTQTVFLLAKSCGVFTIEAQGITQSSLYRTILLILISSESSTNGANMLLRAIGAAIQKKLGDVTGDDPIRGFFRTEVR